MSLSDPNPDKPSMTFFWAIVCCGCIAMLSAVLVADLAIQNRFQSIKPNADMENKKINATCAQSDHAESLSESDEEAADDLQDREADNGIDQNTSPAVMSESDADHSDLESATTPQNRQGLIR